MTLQANGTLNMSKSDFLATSNGFEVGILINNVSDAFPVSFMSKCRDSNLTTCMEPFNKTFAISKLILLR